MPRILTWLLAFVALLGLAVPVLAQNDIVLGIMPVYDSSAERYGLHLAPNLTYMLFQQLQAMPDVQPVLLSPGGLYDPTADEWITEFAQRGHVDAVLIPTLLPSLKDGERHRDLQLEVQVLNVATGQRSSKQLNQDVKVSVADLILADTTHRNFWAEGQQFSKQPLGKAANKLALWTQQYLETIVPGMKLGRSGNAAFTADSCEVRFRVRYKQRNSTSKSYGLTVNDKEQSSTINEGTAHFTARTGSLAIRLQVEDAPMRMPTQELYQASTMLDCAAPNHTLIFELGAAGEGLFRWEQ